MTASQVSNYSHVVCVFCKILPTTVLIASLTYRKLCKLAKVSYTRVSYNSSEILWYFHLQSPDIQE